MAKKYSVNVYEVWARYFTVEADSKEEAIDKVNDLISQGVDNDEGFEYSHTKDIDDWFIEEERVSASITDEKTSGTV